MKSETEMTGPKAYGIRNERVLYATIWTIASLLPIVLEFWEYINNSSFDWHPIITWWKGMIPLAQSYTDAASVKERKNVVLCYLCMCCPADFRRIFV